MVISLPTADAASTRHEHTSRPSTSTEHDPHSPCSHAPFGARQPEPLAEHVEQALAEPRVGDVVVGAVDVSR